MEVHEEVVTALRRDLGGGPRVEQRVVDVLDVHLHVVRLSPPLDPGVVEPVVVGRYEVHPLNDVQIALELAVPEPERPGERVRRGSTGNTEGNGSGTCLLDQLTPVETSLGHTSSFLNEMRRR